MARSLVFFFLFLTMLSLNLKVSAIAKTKKADWPFSTLYKDNPGMLFPRESETREIKLLDGMWNFKAERNIDFGIEERWYSRPLEEVSAQNFRISQSRKLNSFLNGLSTALIKTLFTFLY